MISQLADDMVEADLDDGARDALLEYIVNGCKGLAEMTDEELQAEFDAAYKDEESSDLSTTR